MTQELASAVAVPSPHEGLTLKQGFLSRVARAAVLALVLQVSGAGLAYVSQVAFARWMGLAQFGTYVYVMAWATLLGLLAGAGFPSSVLRFIPEYRATADDARLRGLVRLSRCTAIAAGSAVAGAGTVLIVLLAPAARGAEEAAILAMWLIPIGALINLDTAIIRAGGRVVGAFGPSLVVRPAGILLIAGVVWLLTGRLTALDGVLATFAAFVAIALVQVGLVRGVVGHGHRARPHVYESRTWLGVSMALFLVVGFQIALGQADLLIIGATRGVRSAALYLAATKTAMLVTYLLVALNAVTAPLFSEFELRGDRAGLQRLVSVSEQWVFWPTLVLAALLALLAPHILALFGPRFVTARWALYVLLVGQLANAGCGAVGYLLGMTGHQKDTARVYGITAVFNVALCYVGARTYGLTGAACATTFSMVTWNVWLHHVTKKRIGIRASIFSSLALWRAGRA
jgi:O-antigen/teichoic acid export membrane protein